MAAANEFQGAVAGAQATLLEIESTVFQFSHRVRLFLQHFPADLPKPLSVQPSISSPLDSSYLHLVCATPDEVATWASWMGTSVKRVEQHNAVFTSATADVEGLPLHVGCMTLSSQAERQPGGDH
ncbi:hypothetical protein L1I79_27640 [Strepomyces sp. STD 3.1]|nr:hypothetical protein [Streptomyces sp. STD 3.1]